MHPAGEESEHGLPGLSDRYVVMVCSETAVGPVATYQGWAKQCRNSRGCLR